MRSDARKKLAATHAPEVGTEARVSAFLDAWHARTGNDHEIIYDLDGGPEYGGTGLRWTDLRALLDALADERVRVEHFKARLLVRYRELDAMRERAEAAERTLAVALRDEPPTRDEADA